MGLTNIGVLFRWIGIFLAVYLGCTKVAAGKAKLILIQNFAGSWLTPWAPVGPTSFMKGLAARAEGSTGTCTLNMVVHGGYSYLTRGPAL